MGPPDQRLNAGQPAADEVHDGLVVHPKLAGLKRRRHGVVDGKWAKYRLGRTNFELIDDHHAAASGALGLVHRHVGFAHQDVAVWAGSRDRRADTDARPQLPAGKEYWGFNGGEQPLTHGGCHLCRVVRGQLQQHGKLVAGQPRHEVRGACCQRELAGDVAEQCVAGIVPELVVDLLEAVQVQEEHRDRPRLRSRAGPS